MVKQWSFSQLDTWFFKEARPFDSVGATQLDTILLPPPARTVAGAIRTLIGENQGINWKEFNQNHKLAKEIGYSDDLGKLQLTGPYLLYNEKQNEKQLERLYPVPLNILKGKTTGKKEEIEKFVNLVPGELVKCDLGTVRLPEKTGELKGAKPIEDAWLNQKDFERVLSGKFPRNIIYNKDLFTIENRVGIALDTSTRITKEHHLYQNQHIRIHHDKNLKIGMLVDGIKDRFHPSESDLINFGGEGRLAEVLINEENSQMKTPILKDEKYIFLTLLTAANLGNNWLPDESFIKSDNDDFWQGEIKGVKLKIISSVLGKSIQEGGWDLVKKQSRAVVSLVPAGSVWFCEVISGDPTKLHGKKIGKDTAFGRGELAVGKWENKI
ncbi:type III-B CRISPR module-associated protein Cmr3 [Candidatus Halobeggiatoa sp. HSG11]|nr:type III-B CRISPR module-associated protein Cmr3 [Candidatus Halobeggiatoa sp. HSG11]